MASLLRRWFEAVEAGASTETASREAGVNVTAAVCEARRVLEDHPEATERLTALEVAVMRCVADRYTAAVRPALQFFSHQASRPSSAPGRSRVEVLASARFDLAGPIARFPGCSPDQVSPQTNFQFPKIPIQEPRSETRRAYARPWVCARRGRAGTERGWSGGVPGVPEPDGASR